MPLYNPKGVFALYDSCIRSEGRYQAMGKTITFDIDGTLTDYSRFADRYAVPYLSKKYGFYVVNENALEIEDILAIADFFIMEGYSPLCAEAKVRAVMRKFWHSPYALMYAPFGRFRKNAANLIRHYLNTGYSVEIHTNRAGKKQYSPAAWFVRLCTKCQFLLNGVQPSRLRFLYYADDNEKALGIIAAQPELVYEDKPQIIMKLSNAGIHTMCVSGRHNKRFSLPNLCERIDGFGTAT